VVNVVKPVPLVKPAALAFVAICKMIALLVAPVAMPVLLHCQTAVLVSALMCLQILTIAEPAATNALQI
jgi:hypothetical protein